MPRHFMSTCRKKIDTKERQTMIDLMVVKDLVDKYRGEDDLGSMLADILTKEMQMNDTFGKSYETVRYSLSRNKEEPAREEHRRSLRQQQ